MRIFCSLLIYLLIVLSCNQFEATNNKSCNHISYSSNQIRGALLASRINSLEELNSLIDIKYYINSTPSKAGTEKNNKVSLKHCNGSKVVISELEAGISQTDVSNANDGDFLNLLKILFNSPKSISIRKELNIIYLLARRDHIEFGYQDIAFYDLALEAENRIINKEKAYLTKKDKGEKGYINTINHITAQAFITSLFSEEIADLIADLHELKNMPEIVHGRFSEKQLKDSINNPIDNYVDLINNEWGQEIGKKLKVKYSINKNTIWSPKLTANFLNDLQAYYSWSFQMSMDPFNESEDLIIKFSDKLNSVIHNT